MGHLCGDVSSFKQDSVWSWFICVCSTICMILTLGFSFALGVLFPVLMDSFKENRERTAWISSVVLGSLCLLGPVMGAFLNRFGIRIATILGCLLCSAALAVGSFVNSVDLLCITFSFPFGLGASLIYVTATVVATHYFNKRRSIALGFITGGQGLGTMILGPTLQALVDFFDWRNTFRVFAGALFLASMTGWFLHQGTSSPNEHKQASSKKFSFNFSLLKSPFIVALLITVPTLYTFSRMVPYVHLIKYCDDLGISGDKSSTLFLFIGIFSTLGRLGGGCLCNIRRIKPRFLFQVVSFTVGASTMLLTLAKSYDALVPYAIVFSLADGMMVTSYVIQCLNALEESKKASGFGFSMMSAGVGALSSPPLSGFMADRFGNYIAAFFMAGGVGIIASLTPFIFPCLEPESKDKNDYEIEKLEDPGQSADVAGRDLHSLQQGREDELELVSGTAMVHKDNQRPVSFIMAMESPV